MRKAVFDTYGHRCIRCFKPTNEVHEITPRSQDPDWFDLDNMIPLCHNCHLGWAHRIGAQHAAPVLRRLQTRALQFGV